MNKHMFGKAPDLGLAMDAAARRGSVEVDVAKYQAYLDDPSLSDAQKEEIVKAAWTIMTTFVELGFGVHPAQQVCGQLENGLDPRSASDSDGPEDIAMKQEFNDAPDQE